MLRKLRVLAAFFMVPVVVFVTPAAATASGGWTTVNLDVPAAPFIGDAAPGTIDSIDCTFSLQQTGGVIATSTGVCYGLPDVTFGYTQDGESGSGYSITVSGLNGVGPCGGSDGGTLQQHPANGTMRVAGTIPSGTIYAGDGDCALTQVCITLASGRDACQTVDIPPLDGVDPTDPTGTCAAGTPHVSGEWRSNSATLDPNNSLWGRWDYWITVTRTGNPLGTTQWGVSARPGGPIGSGGFQADATSTSEFMVQTRNTYNDPTKPVDQHQGIEVYAVVANGWNQPVVDVYSANVGTARPTGAGMAYMGWNQPEQCRWYFGPKIVSDSTSDADEPEGDGLTPYVEPEPDPEPLPPDPDSVDEPDDEETWLGSIWALLRTIWGAIVQGFSAVVTAVKGLVTGIVDGITGFFEAAFVPSDGYLDSKWAGVENKWDGTSPGLYVDAVADLSPGSVSGCGGMPLNVTLPGGVALNQNIGAACSGPMASAAGIVRAAVTAVFAVGGAIACVRAVGSGLGWNPGIGRGGAS